MENTKEQTAEDMPTPQKNNLTIEIVDPTPWKEIALDLQERVMDNELYAIPNLESENERIKVEAHKALRLDRLTGCQNFVAFNEWVESNKAPERLNHTGLIYVDINNLKEVNDTFGHEAGDKLITEVASLLKIIFKDDGIVFRKYRGDEFVIGCHNLTNKDNYEKYLTSKIIEAQSLASEMFFRFKNSGTKIESFISLSFAGGVAVFDGKPHNDNKIDLSLYDTDRRADSAMYDNKTLMKNSGQPEQ